MEMESPGPVEVTRKSLSWRRVTLLDADLNKVDG